MMAQKSDRETSLRAEYDVFFFGFVEGVSYISMRLRCSGFLIPKDFKSSWLVRNGSSCWQHGSSFWET